MHEMFDLAGRVAVVTGASSGLGLAISEALAASGAKVVMTSSNGDRLASAVDGVCANYPGAAVAKTLDVGDRNAIRKVIAEIAEEHGRIDILVANAGVSAGPGFKTEIGKIANLDDTVWNRVLDVNLTGVAICISAASPHLAANGVGRVVVISSIAGLRSEELVGYAYVTTKAAVINLVRQAAVELAPRGVLVNAIAPGPFLTNIANGRLRDPAVAAEFASSVPLGRVAQPDEIKGLALLLCSDASSFITGQCFAIDGGKTVQ